MRLLRTLVLLALPLPLAAQGVTSPMALVRRAVDAIGGEAALRGVATTRVDFHTVVFSLGQEETWDSPARATMSYGQILTDWRGNRRVQTAENRPVTGNPTRTRRVVAGGIGMSETDGRQGADVGAAVAGTQRTMRLQPERLLLAALDAPGSVLAHPARIWRGETMDAVRIVSAADTVAMYFDRLTGIPTVLEQVIDHPVLGDARNVSWFTRWQDAGGGVRLPRQQDSELNGRMQAHTVMTAVAVNAALDEGLFTIADSIAARAQRVAVTGAVAVTPPVVVTLAQLAPRVWRAEGGTHHTLVVEQPDGLVLVEAPLHSARSRAVMDTLRSRFPGRRITTVVNTHHHWDHAGGVRGYVGEGIAVVTHERNASFIRQMATARKTAAPDALTRRPRAALVRPVRDSLVLGSGDSRVVVYAFPNTHVEGMLAAYLPAARILFQSDVPNPTGTTAPPAGARELVAFARRRGIEPATMAGGHGVALPWSEVSRAAGQ